jgi:putative SOS response-associated peptidase YedK
MCNLYSITTNQAAIIALFRVINRCVGNLPPMPGVFPDYLAPVVRKDRGERQMVMMRWGGLTPNGGVYGTFRGLSGLCMGAGVLGVHR